ncbi:MAG: hypothetical protein J6K55_12900 [Clostridia bacterium]|nr:hypothetical protein [Clostridia bacterium]
MFDTRTRLTGAWPFSPGILVVLSMPIDAVQAQNTIDRARAQASRPALLRFALPVPYEGSVNAGDSGLCFYDGVEPLLGGIPMENEKYFLLISGEHDFSPRWDALLTGVMRSLSDKPTLLTGSITRGISHASSQKENTVRPPAVNPGGLNTLRQALPEIRRRRMALKKEPESNEHPPEICLPAIKESLNDTEHVIGAGLPLVCSAAPVPTLLLDPAFVFGPVAFLSTEELRLNTLSLSAYVEGYRCCVPDTLCLCPVVDHARRMLHLPGASMLPGTTLSRFRQLIGLDEGQSMAHAKAALGIFGNTDHYPQRMPAALKMAQKAHEARQQLMETHLPLLVSAFVDLPAPRYPLPFYLLRFGFLRRIESLPLVLYTGGALERQLRTSFPHTHSYPDNGVLPRTLLSEGMTPMQHFARSKPFLLYHAVSRQVEFTHVAWLDMDVLPHPICTDALPDLEPLMDDRIHMAAVGGVPDASFVMMPVKLAPAVAREAKSITLLDAELKRGFSEELLWERLFMKRPQWFTIHPMPRRRLLFLSSFDPRFLSHAIRPLLKEPAEPFEGTPADGRRAAARTPRTFKETEL